MAIVSQRKFKWLVIVMSGMFVGSSVFSGYLTHDKHVYQGKKQQSQPPYLRHNNNPKKQQTNEVTPKDKWFHLLGPKRLNGANINCQSLLEGDIEAIKNAKHKQYKRSVLGNDIFPKLLENCTEFKIKRSYQLQPGSLLEGQFPIAFSVLFYKEFQVVERLIRSIYRPQNVFCLHVDAKAPEQLHAAARAFGKCFENVFIASKLEEVRYAHFSRLQAEINCMSDILTKGEPWKYYINLASEAFPLRTNLELVKILQIYNGANDIEMDGRKKILPKRFTFEHIFVNGRWNHTGRRNPLPPMNMTMRKGGAYGVFSRAFVNFIVNNKYAKDFLEWSKSTWSPDEHFFATLDSIDKNTFLNTPGGFKGSPETKPWLASFSGWSKKECFSGNFWPHGVCIFGIGDLQNLASKQELFANKFHLGFQDIALDCLEEWHYNRTLHPTIFNTMYYRKLNFVADATSLINKGNISMLDL